MKSVAQAQMLLVQATETEQLTRRNHHLLGEQALEHLAHVDCPRGAQPERRPGGWRTVGHLFPQVQVQALAHVLCLLAQLQAQRSQVHVDSPALTKARNGALADRRQPKGPQQELALQFAAHASRQQVTIGRFRTQYFLERRKHDQSLWVDQFAQGCLGLCETQLTKGVVFQQPTAVAFQHLRDGQTLRGRQDEP